MNSLVLIVLSFVFFFFGYRWYAAYFERRFEINPARTPPSVAKYDGVDYVPAKNWFVLFGHHFSSIAGAGPIIGPVIAVMVWGWLPAVIWIVLGTIFIGGIHDFGSLLISVRENGNSVAETANRTISSGARIMFSWFVLLALILVISVFAYLGAKTFVNEPRVVLPSFGLIPMAIVLGFMIYRMRVNFILATLLGLGVFCGLIYAGFLFPVRIGGGTNIWLIILFLYAFIASVTPVHILLQPRDYLSGFLLFAGLIFGYAGIFILRPQINTPAYINWSTDYGMLWPMLFVTVACGAVSGFHSLISSGTTSKQLPNERFARRIGYGSMVAEGILAIMAAVAVTSSCMVSDNLGQLLKESGPINIFGRGFGIITAPILGKFGKFLALTILNVFILTTLDTATRIARYLFGELFGLKNRFVSTAVIVIVSLYLALSGRWNILWPAFGAANQLVAALTLLVISGWLIRQKKSFGITLIPAVFMLLTTQLALILQVIQYIRNKDFVLLLISILLLGLSGFVVRGFLAVLNKRDKNDQIRTN